MGDAVARPGARRFRHPKAEVSALARRAARLAFLVGIPCVFLLSMAAGELTDLIPRPSRARSALAMSLLMLPVYSILIVVAVVERNADHHRATGIGRCVGRFVVVVISLVAAFSTLGAIMSSAGPYFAS